MFICGTEEELSRIENEKNQVRKFEKSFDEIDQLIGDLEDKKEIIFNKSINGNDIIDVRTHYNEGQSVFRLNIFRTFSFRHL